MSATEPATEPATGAAARLAALTAEAERIMNICNACRYCEGHCAVFPAMEMRLSFGATDLGYLANLCHDCQACYHHCQYAPPHEFAVNVPRALSELRTESYVETAWPRPLGFLYRANGVKVGVITAAAFSLFMLAIVALVDPAALSGIHRGPGAFYAVIPHEVMVTVFGAAFLFAMIAMGIATVRFWRWMASDAAQSGAPGGAPDCAGALAEALHDAARLRYLDGGAGDGCTYPTEAPSMARRWFHHFTAYGFLLCFAATCVATLYHYGFGWVAPYGFTALPVALGTVGGIGLVVGPAGLLWLRHRADPGPRDPQRIGMDTAFTVLLLLTSLTGLALLALRDTAAMGWLLAIHLGVVLGLFVTLPYGKFIHAFYRVAALTRYALERRRGQAL